MKKRMIVIVILCFVIGGCGKAKVDDIKTNIVRIEQGNFYVNCPVENNKLGSGEDIGYTCMIMIDNDTELKDTKGTNLKFEDYKQGDPVRVILTEKQNITKNNMDFFAKEIILLEINN